MKIPSKFITYKKSVISKFPIVLDFLKDNALSVENLYNKTKKNLTNIDEFIDILSCLFMLNKIDFDYDKGVLYYVKRN